MNTKLQHPVSVVHPSMSTFCMYIVGLASCVSLLSCESKEESKELVRPPVDVPVVIEPMWPEFSPSDFAVVDSAQNQSFRRLSIYLDLSSPMAGFVSLPGTESGVAGGELRMVAHLVQDHLGRVYPGVPIHWRGVAENIENLPQNPILRRDTFKGKESRLDLAIGEIIADLHTGTTQGGAIITDLVGTGGGTGGAEVARHLTPWLTSMERRASDFHFGLIGVRATYWGAFHREHCPSRRDGALGCWFSERMPGWKSRLSAPITVPFYVLLFGRGVEKLEEIAESVLWDAKSILRNAEVEDSVSVSVVWELLTASDKPPRNTIITFEEIFPKEQLVLWKDKDNGTYGCYRDGKVELQGSFRQTRFAPTETLLALSSGETPIPLTPELDGDSLEIQVHCVAGAIRKPTPKPVPRLSIKSTMRPPDNRPIWENWSTPTDDTLEHPGKTLQLKYFVEETRVEPTFYRLDLNLDLGLVGQS